MAVHNARFYAYNGADLIRAPNEGILRRNIGGFLAGTTLVGFGSPTVEESSGGTIMIAIVWAFDVRPGCEGEFERVYGAGGEWTAMNRQSRSYLGSSFLRDQSRKGRYLLIEYWSEMLVYEEHKVHRRDEIARFEERRNALVAFTEPLGVFTALDAPDRSGPTWSRRSSQPGTVNTS